MRHSARYARELRLSLRNNAGAYGYSVMITCCLGMLAAQAGPPEPHDIFTFLIGASASFTSVELVATNGFRRSLREQESAQVVALGSALNLFSVSLSIGATMLVARVVPTNLAWGLGAFVASVVYLVVTSIEMSVARRIEEARGFDVESPA